MSEQPDARDLLEKAEHAAITGDLSSADQLLRSAARIQEAELGPLHPDLANTLNNLAIVAEKTGRFGDAETFYRRAAAIAAASLPPDHAMVAESRRNLEDFCRERGLPIVAAVTELPQAQGSRREPVALAPDLSTRKAETATVATPAAQAATAKVLKPSPRPPARSRQLLWAAIGAIVLVAILFLIVRRPSSPDAPVQSPVASEPTPSASAPPATPAPIDPPKPAKVVPQGGISLITVQLCKTFSTSGSTWRCDAIDDPAPQAPIVLYTRVRSPRNAAIVHRWYRGETLQQSVKLSILANASEGYRTYSRQTVSPGNWRIEVVNADGDVLHERRFTVR